MQSTQAILLFLLAAQSVLAWGPIGNLRTELEPVSTVSIPTVEQYVYNPYNYLVKRFGVSGPAYHKILRIEEPWNSVLSEDETPAPNTNEVLVQIVNIPRVVIDEDEHSAPVAYSTYSHPNIYSRVLHHNQIATRHLPAARIQIMGYPGNPIYPRSVRSAPLPYSFDHNPLADNLISGLTNDDFVYPNPGSVEDYPTPAVDYPNYWESHFQPQSVESAQTYPGTE